MQYLYHDPRLITYKIGYAICLYCTFKWVKLMQLFNLYPENGQNDQKMRLYDVNSMKNKFLENFNIFFRILAKFPMR